MFSPHLTKLGIVLSVAAVFICCLLGIGLKASSHRYLEIQRPFPSAELGSWGFIDKQGNYMIRRQFNSGGIAIRRITILFGYYLEYQHA